jgi:bifunctional non-homologous end joining protein LigD
MVSRFVIHQHKAGRTHFDLRILIEGVFRSWSLLKEPPLRPGERRLAIERESFPPESMRRANFEEEAFGSGRVSAWDEGEVEVNLLSSRHLSLAFRGARISGNYELRRMLWYPGNRWLLTRKPPGRTANTDENYRKRRLALL